MSSIRFRMPLALALLAAVAGVWMMPGGAMATARKSAEPINLVSVSFGDTHDGWASGQTSGHGYMFHTTNGGRSWSLTQLGWYASQMQFIDSKTGWAIVTQVHNCGSQCNSAVTHTSDGGHSWSLQLNGGSCWDIASLDFITAKEGWAVETNDKCHAPDKPLKTRLMTTADGGQNWHRSGRAYNGQIVLTSVHFGSPSDGWLAGNLSSRLGGCGTIVYHTTNAGASWSSQFVLHGYCLSKIDFVSTTQGWLLVSNSGACSMGGCYDNRLYRTVNGGSKWKLEQKHPGWAGSCGFLTQPHFTNASVGYMPVTAGQSCGIGGLDVTRDGGGHWSRQAPLHHWVNDVSPISSSNVWAVGCSQRTHNCRGVLHTTNAGHSWSYHGLHR